MLRKDVKDLLLSRGVGWVTLSVVDRGEARTFDDVARRAGLFPLGEGWRQVDSAAAREMLAWILHRGLAYSVELMPFAQASRLAEEFLGVFGSDDTRFATNLSATPNSPTWSSHPATQHTLDAGIVCLSPSLTGVYWVAEED